MPPAEVVSFPPRAAPQTGPKSFGGGYLAKGSPSRLLYMARFIYIDEAGTSVKEPVTVVAGIFVHPDKQWREAQAYLENLRQEVPEEIQEGFVFHATELFSGGKKFDRKKWNSDFRWPILRKLVAGARLCKLPIVVAYNRKHPQEEGWDPQAELFFRHAVAFHSCLRTANAGMKLMYPSELGTLVAEDHPTMRQWLKQLPDMLRETSAPEFFTGPHPYDSIVDAIHFTGGRCPAAAICRRSGLCCPALSFRAQRRALVDAGTNWI
jgi:hypothetical protein